MIDMYQQSGSLYSTKKLTQVGELKISPTDRNRLGLRGRWLCFCLLHIRVGHSRLAKFLHCSVFENKSQEQWQAGVCETYNCKQSRVFYFIDYKYRRLITNHNYFKTI